MKSLLRVSLSCALLLPCAATLLGTSPDAPRSQGPDERRQQRAAQLSRLRQAAHAWLARTTPAETRTLNRAYADLTFAFSLARIGAADAARALHRSAADTLGQKDEVHRCLLNGFTYRIDQALAGKPHAGPLPAEVFAPLGGKEPAGGDRIPRYRVDRLRQSSRILEPQEDVNPYRAWQTRYLKGSLKELATLPDVRDKDDLERRIRRLLTAADAAREELTIRLRLLAEVLSLASRVSDTGAAELIGRVIPLLREVSGGKEPPALEETTLLLERALRVATARGNKETVRAFANWAGDWLKARLVVGEFDRTGTLTAQLLHALGKFGLRDDARSLLVQLSDGGLNAKSLARLRERYGARWPNALAALLQTAGGWLSLGRTEEAAPILEEARRLLFPAAEQGHLLPVVYTKLACAYAAALGHGQAEEAVRRLEELFKRMERVPETFTTTTHFALLPFRIIETVALALDPIAP